MHLILNIIIEMIKCGFLSLNNRHHKKICATQQRSPICRAKIFPGFILNGRFAKTCNRFLFSNESSFADPHSTAIYDTIRKDKEPSIEYKTNAFVQKIHYATVSPTLHKVLCKRITPSTEQSKIHIMHAFQLNREKRKILNSLNFSSKKINITSEINNPINTKALYLSSNRPENRSVKYRAIKKTPQSMRTVKSERNSVIKSPSTIKYTPNGALSIRLTSEQSALQDVRNNNTLIRENQAQKGIYTYNIEDSPLAGWETNAGVM